jgi:transcriptional regulator with XRE-family HTH domain
VGATIRSARNGAGVTQIVLAERLGVSAAYIGKLEAGRANPTVGMLARVARALDSRLNVEFTSEPVPVAQGAVALLRG